MVTAAIKSNNACSLEGKYDKPRQHIKRKDVSLPTKVHIVKVVMYRSESWTIKKAEHRRIDAFKLWCWRTLESPLGC